MSRNIGNHTLICNLQMEIKYEIKSYLFCFIVESTVVQSEMEVVLRCERDVHVDALTVVDFICDAPSLSVFRFQSRVKSFVLSCY